jgi:hypothetical protein
VVTELIAADIGCTVAAVWTEAERLASQYSSDAMAQGIAADCGVTVAEVWNLARR